MGDYLLDEINAQLSEHMNPYIISKHATFFCIGLSYKKSSIEIRGKFYLDKKATCKVLEQAIQDGLDEIVAISTCNRSEIYGFANNALQLIKLLCNNSNGSIDEFHQIGYIYKNDVAISHIYKVAVGLDSQILGDFEIIGQLKKGFNLSKKYKLSHSFFTRLFNSVSQASKIVKNRTDISSGATSIAFAAVKYIMNNIDNIYCKNILLFGIGKIGRNTCTNLIKHTNNNCITLINRTESRASKFAFKFNVNVTSYANLEKEICKTDILIVATGAKLPTISKDMISKDKELLILDLSVPKNVSENVLELQNVKLVNLDYLSQVTYETNEHRKSQISMAQAIIEDVKNEFFIWTKTLEFTPIIKALKIKLERIRFEEIDFQRKRVTDFNEAQGDIITERIVQKIIKHFVNYLKENNNSLEISIEVISEIFQLKNLFDE